MEPELNDDSDEIKKKYKILCRYPLVLESLIKPLVNFFVVDTLLDKDEYLISDIEQNEKPEELEYINFKEYETNYNKIIITNKRFLHLISSTIYLADKEPNNTSMNGYIVPNRTIKLIIIENGIMLNLENRYNRHSCDIARTDWYYEYDKIKHCLDVRLTEWPQHSGQQYYARGYEPIIRIIYAPNLLYTLSLPLINMIVSLLKNNFINIKSLIKEKDLDKKPLIQEKNIQKSIELNEDDKKICSICMESYVNPIAIKTCGHIYCFKCINYVCESSIKKCPLCKKNITTFDLLKLYF